MNSLRRLFLGLFTGLICLGAVLPEPASGQLFKKKKAQSSLDTPEYHYRLGVPHLDSGDYRTASQAFRRSVDLDRKFALGWGGLGLTTALLGNYSDGKKYVNRGTKLSPSKAEVWIYHGRYWLANDKAPNHLGKAKGDFKKALQLSPGNEAAEYYLGEAFLQGYEFRKAENQFSRVAARKGTMAQAADARWATTQKIVRARPGTLAGRKIATKEKITRADLAVLLVVELKIVDLIRRRNSVMPENAASARDIYGNWAEPWIKEVLKLGILEPGPDGKFFPSQNISRVDFAMLIQRILVLITRDMGLETRYLGESPSRFSDVPSSHFAYNAMALSAERGILKADIMTGKFSPRNEVSGADGLLILRELQNSLRLTFGGSSQFAKRPSSNRPKKRSDRRAEPTKVSTKADMPASRPAPAKKPAVVADTTPPTIQITSPVISRAMKRVRQEKTILVKGKATDASGIVEVLVDGTEAQVMANGEFWAEVSLAFGENRIVVEATDKRKNSASTAFTVTRKSGVKAPPVVAEKPDPIVLGKYYALIIGIDKYTGDWQPLDNAVHDARGVRDMLSNNYRFDHIEMLLDKEATRANIFDKLDWLAENLTEDDNLLIYYSGHGEYKERMNKGYWVPVDATGRATGDYLSNSALQDFMNGIPTRHTLLISDACFSGDIFRSRTESVSRDEFDNMERYYREVAKLMSRQAFTSGGIEPVMDGGREGHSIFTYYFLRALEQNSDPYYDAAQVFERLRRPVGNNSEQTPILQAVKNTGDEGGQFIFVRKR